MAKKAIEIEVVGAKEVAAAMAKLTKPASRFRVLRPGVTKAGRVVRNSAKSLVPRGTAPLTRGRKRLYQTLISVTRTYRKTGSVVAVIGPSGKKKGGDSEAVTNKHGHLVEAGTSERQRKSGGSTGRMPASNFLDRALKQTASQTLAIIRNSIPNQVDKEVARVAARGTKAT